MAKRIASIMRLLLLCAAPALAQPIDADPRWQPPPPAPPDAPSGPPAPAPQDRPTVYAGLRGSYAFTGNQMTVYTATAPSSQLRSSYAVGGGGSVYIGTRLPLNLRLELEGLYVYQPLSRLSLNGVNTGATGYTQLAAPMMNLMWDIPVPDDLLLEPFVGMGVGAAYSQSHFTSPGNTYTSQNTWDLAYSFMAGFAVPLDEYSRLTALYRFMQVRDADHKCATAGLLQSACFDGNVNTSTVEMGYEMDL